jgi:uncharacterized membrane protein YfcA
VEVLDLSLLQLGIALLAVVAGATLQGSLGFGLGLVAAPVLVLLDTRLVPGPILCMGVPLTLLVAWREREALDFDGIRWAIVGRVPGAVIGAFAVVLLAERWLAALFAIAILSAVGLSALGLTVAPTRRNLFAAGVTSGLMGTATSVGGPPVAMVYQRNSGPELRASLAAFMVFGAGISQTLLTAVGEFDLTDLGLAALFVPAVLTGFVLSRWSNQYLDRGYTRPAVLVFAAASAISILIRQVL